MHTDPLKATGSRWKQLARRIVPSRLQAHLRELRELSSAERRAHVGVTLRRFAFAPSAIPPSLDANGAVLFVCHGNIIRSALAAALVQRRAAALGLTLTRVSSAGLFARAGREADARAVAAGRTLGVDLAEHRAQPLTQALVDEAAVIFVMDRLNEAQLLARFPGAGRKLRRLGALAPVGGDDVIADPYVLDAKAVAAVAARIARATEVLVTELARRGGHGSGAR